MASVGTEWDPTTEAAVEAEQVRRLYRQSPLIMALNPINAAIVGAVLWSAERGGQILAWLAATALVAALRAVLRARFLRAQAPSERTWGRWFALGAGASGVLWGLGSLLFYDPSGGAGQILLFFVVAGMTAGASGTLAYHLPAFMLFAAPTILPLSMRMALQGDAPHMAMGVLGVVFGMAMALIAGHAHRALTEAFRLRFQNQALLGRLSRTQTSLELANRTLEQRVDERTAEVRRHAEALQEARRMESLGLLAGGVAHDFNNLLTVILGNVTVLLADAPMAEPARAALGEIRGAAERAASLVSQLLASSRRQSRRPRVLDLNSAVSDAHRLLSRLIGEHIDLVVALRAWPLPVEADPGQLEQVIVNLATNARDAMVAGGRLTIETDEMEVAPSGSALAPGLQSGRYVVLSVRDTGIGMDAETRRKVFHPFFTTKEVGHGTGLGLATVNGIVEQSGGRVFVESEPGRGSCFRVFLPRAAAPIAREGAAPESAAPRRAATVLLVEDEPMVRMVVSRALAGAGLTVLEAENGEHGLERARAHQGPIDLLITDVVMARMGGPELAKRLAEDRPGIPVLFVSGYSRDIELPAVDIGEGIDFLQKPFTSSAVLDRVSRLLAVRPRPPGPGPDVAAPNPVGRSPLGRS